MTQCEWLLEQLEKGRKLSQIDMLMEGGIGNHTGRISDLRRDLELEGKGRLILHEWEEKNGKVFARYHLHTPNPIQLNIFRG